MTKSRIIIDLSAHKPKRQLPISPACSHSTPPPQPPKDTDMSEWLDENYPKRPFFTIAETAVIIGMSQDFVRDHIATGEIHAVGMGSHYRVPFDELARILEQGVN